MQRKSLRFLSKPFCAADHSSAGFKSQASCYSCSGRRNVWWKKQQWLAAQSA